MSSENTIRARLLPNGKVVQVMPDGTTRSFEGRTDWAALKALSDPDTVLLTEEELAQLPEGPNLKEIRARLQLTQEQFAEKFQVPLGTLRDWEQGVSVPDSAAKNYLRVIAKNPQAVLEALAG